MKIQVAEATNTQLDWMVAKCEGHPAANSGPRYFGRIEKYTTNWSQGGPIAERERIWVKYPFGETGEIEAIHGRFGFPNIVNAFGATELVARMRCFIISRLGKEVEVPDELA